MRFLRRSLVGLFLMAVTVGLLAYAGHAVYGALETVWNREERVRPANERIFAVNVRAYDAVTVTPVLTGFGEVRSRRTLEVRATASGTVVELAEAFEDGGTVREGDLLLRVDPRTAEAALEVARTDLAGAEAELRDARRALVLAGDDVVSAEDQAALRTQALARARNMASSGIGTEAAVDDAALAEASALQAILSRRQALAAAEARVDIAQNDLARAEIALSDAERALADTELYAAFTGTLSDVTVVEGRLVQNNEQLANLVDPDRLEVSFRISNAEYARILDADGDLMQAPVRISLDVLGGNLVTDGVITRESASVGTGTTGRLIFARIDAPRGFRPGDFVSVHVDEPELQDVAVLPSTALDAAGTVLVVGEDERLEIAQVELLRRQGDDVIVRGEGLEGRLVVAERSPLLGAGIKVRPVSPELDSARAEAEAPAMVELTEERRAALVALVEANQFMPQAAKDRVLAQLAEPMVPAATVERIESRRGG
ncbi:efflux RND transporter periplasmic adaptor subunit [Psychromarinibacter halotolerans]|uniref:Efflux RND transporter periplasmic adaptor subunit n=1 Tax=Psychromarinibacter halotolerans TaxID=1775175 RepID=A0ABV7GKL8_9RHOB|nr:HlyD family efflux transporter periplasmic adaptor subunit [Psychromarinibacter halotolerans]MDF0595428.1 HlyD family efflux transporter periplasmic adaptor subunit [Psychromarinibacter halotolerans]